MARWPLHPAPLDDETLSSWLSRLAAAYEMEPTVFCHDTLALTPQSLQEVDACPPTGLLTTLAAHTGWSIARVEAMTLRHYEGIVLETLDRAAPPGMAALIPRFHPDRRYGDGRATDLRQWGQLPRCRFALYASSMVRWCTPAWPGVWP